MVRVRIWLDLNLGYGKIWPLEVGLDGNFNCRF